jgi:hypothetical protein
VRLLLTDTVEGTAAIRDLLALPLELVDSAGYGSLPMAGLAALKLSP